MSEKKILVADDSLTIQKVIRLALSGDGYQIQTVSDGKECLEQASLFRPDICIIDVSLPQFDAYQIREKFLTKPDLKNIPVILMSSAFEKVDEARAQKLGFAGHLIKPFDPSHLRSTLLSVAAAAPKNDPVTETINESMTSPSPSHHSTYVDPFADAAIDPVIEPFTNAHVTPEPKIKLQPSSHSHQEKTPSAFQETKSAYDDFPTLHSGGNPMDDIQQLARNTFELSGLNQHDWGMIEPGKAEVGSMDGPARTDQHPIQKTDQNPSRSSHQDFSGDFPVNTEHSHSGHPTGQATYSADEVEAIVKAEVTRVLMEMHSEIQERMEHEIRAIAHKEVPELAEKIIKEEIRKLLSEPPI
jgi:two-component system cell cycle response regulator